jgi:predicted AlkP superfamily phosphohydrolase/phosphomutase
VVIKRVFKREEIYSGPQLHSMPDLVVEPADGYMVSAEFTAGSLVEPTPRMMSGTHRMDGLLMIRGEPFLPGVKVEGASIVDLPPTILYLLGLSIPSDMDGKVLEEVFRPSFREENPPRYEEVGEAVSEEEGGVYAEGEREEIEARLSGLGYLD